MKRKDLLFGIMLSIPGIGLGHLYAGDRAKGFIILGVQIALLLLSGVAMIFSSFIPNLIYFAVFGIGIWAMYDTVVLIRLINDNVD